MKHALDNGYAEVEVTQEAEEAWIDLLLSGPGFMLGSPDCTPGYYNNEGQDRGRRRSCSSATPGRVGVLPVHRRVAPSRRLRRPRVPSTLARRRLSRPAVRWTEHDVVVTGTSDGEPGAVDDGA